MLAIISALFSSLAVGVVAARNSSSRLLHQIARCESADPLEAPALFITLALLADLSLAAHALMLAAEAQVSVQRKLRVFST